MAKLKNLQVSFISLVKNPANKKDIVYKCRDKYTDEKLIKITKSTDEGLVYGTVYEPNVKDAEGDWATAETIRKAAHDFLLTGKNFNIDSEHDKVPVGASVVESYINEKGAWDIAVKMDPTSETFQKVKKGEYEGFSMMAMCQKSDEEPPTQPDDIQTLKEDLSKALKEIEVLKGEVSGIPRTRQIIIDESGNVSVAKNDSSGTSGVLQEFDFSKLGQ